MNSISAAALCEAGQRHEKTQGDSQRNDQKQFTYRVASDQREAEHCIGRPHQFIAYSNPMTKASVVRLRLMLADEDPVPGIVLGLPRYEHVDVWNARRIGGVCLIALDRIRSIPGSDRMVFPFPDETQGSRRA
mgnify:CR=1 FL=1